MESQQTVVEVDGKEYLEFELTDEEVLEIADKVSGRHKRLRNLEAEAKSVAQDFKNEIGGVKAEIDKCHKLIAERKEVREVECKIKKDYKAKKIYYVHEGKVMKEVEMTSYEFESRPTHILPEPKKETAETKSRQEEIAEKEAANQVPSGDVRAQTETRDETSVLNAAAVS